LNTAVKTGSIQVRKNEDGEEYGIKLGDKLYPALEVCNVLDTVGGVGYYSDGSSRGIDICQRGINKDIAEFAQQLLIKKQDIFEKEIENLKINIPTTEHLQWFNVENRFQPMGVKMIGVFCSYIKEMGFLDQTKYLAGFQIVPDMVPGFGPIEFNGTKISMRVSEALT
jgi:single-stranded-DNA-specific exonuclease